MAEGKIKAEKRKIKITIADSGGYCDADLSPDLREDILKTVGEALSDRENVVMTRLNDETLERIDALVEIELFKSRSEATAFFIAEGMNSRGDLFERIMPTMEKIRQLKEELRQSLK